MGGDFSSSPLFVRNFGIISINNRMQCRKEDICVKTKLDRGAAPLEKMD